MENFLQLDNVFAGYNHNRDIIKNITFSIQKNCITGIIGPNGSGKSTLLRTIAGKIPYHSGNVIINKKNVFKLTNKERSQLIAVVLQDYIYSELVVQDYILLGRLPHRSPFQFFEKKHDLKIAHYYMKLTDTYYIRNKKMNELSSGEQQLVSIAQALTQQPQLLLLDEPTSHLDVMHQMKILNIIQQLASAQKLTVLFILHDLNLASEYCDQLLLMDKGRIFSKGTPEEVLTYSNIEEVYKTVVITLTNPLSKKPAIFPVSERILKMNNNKK